MAGRGGAADPDRSAWAPLGPGDPERVGPYQVVGRLGAGGMGTVFLARAGDGAWVAVKVLRPELAGDPSFLRMFRHEVAAARRVVGFCTARVLDADLSGDLPYLVTEYVEGVRLDRAIAASGRLSATDLEGLAVGMAAALTAIHGAGVVHRDLKPSNVLLSYFGPKVIDFGIARALDASAITATGRLMGSPGWMAPEQFAQEPAAPAVDIFVWGSLVAFAGTGRRPFGRGSVVEVAYRIRHEPPDLEGLEGRLRQVVEACMAKEPGRRPAAKALLLELLGDHAEPDPQVAATQLLRQSWSPPATPTPPAPAQPPPRRRRRGRAAWGLALVGLVAAAGVALAGRLELVDRVTGGSGPVPVATTGDPAGTGVPARTPPLCELLGDLGVGAHARPAAVRPRVRGRRRGERRLAAGAGGPAPGPGRAPVPERLHADLGRAGRAGGGGAVPVPREARSAGDAGPAAQRHAGARCRARPGAEVTGGELYLLEAGGGDGQLVMFVCNERVLQLHVTATDLDPDPLLVQLAQGANRRLHERTGCPL